MTTELPSSINLCPINFNGFAEINRITGNPEATLLFSKLKFHQINSKLKKSGKTWIARSRQQLSSWFGFSAKKTDGLLSNLEELGLIKRKVGLWYGKKRLFISTTSEINHVPVNQQLLEILIEATGSVRAALIFSKIAYSFANTKIEHENKLWCCLKKQDLADWAGLSIRTIDNMLEILLKKGLILKKNFVWREKLQTHFHIPEFATITLTKHFSKVGKPTNKKNTETSKGSNAQNCRQQPAKKGVSIKIRTNLKKTNNNTSTTNLPTTLISKKSDIIFNVIENELSQRQLKYLEGAFNNTLKRNNLKISSPQELWEQLKFSVLNIQQHKGIKSFQHIVSRCMKILSDGNWRTPIGFNNHSDYGTKIKKQKDRQILLWEKKKDEECQIAKKYKNITFNIKANARQTAKTEKALSFARKIVELTKQAKEVEEGSILNAVDFLSSQINNLIHDGADRNKVISLLKANGN